MSRRYDAAVTLAYVYEPIAYALPNGYSFFTESQLSSMFNEFEKCLAQEKQTAQSAGALRVETRFLQGFAAGEIRDLAEQGNFDLIVMGTHGRKGISHAVLGSVAERVVRTARCPVLTVRAKL